MSESVEQAVADIRFEIEQIDTLLKTYYELFETVQTGTPSLVELTAAASVLHSFYNGLENMFLTVAKIIDTEVPTGPQWHRDLLAQMINPTSARTAILSEDLAVILAKYMVFRHFYRHSYSFVVSLDELRKLVMPLESVWTATRSELCRYLQGIKG